jgi:hypothetical protein
MRLAPFARRTERPVELPQDLFAPSPAESGDARASRRRRVGGLMTVVGIGHACTLLTLLTAALPPPATEPLNVFANLVFDPAAAAPLPSPKGSPRGSKAMRPEPPKTAVLAPPQVDSPVEIPIPSAPGPRQTEPEPPRTPEESLGSETGRERGDLSGIENGSEQGRNGGRLGGPPTAFRTGRAPEPFRTTTLRPGSSGKRGRSTRLRRSLTRYRPRAGPLSSVLGARGGSHVRPSPSNERTQLRPDGVAGLPRVIGQLSRKTMVIVIFASTGWPFLSTGS